MPSTANSSRELLIQRHGPVFTVTFNRAHQYNAITASMYDSLMLACGRANSDPTIRAMVLRGAGDKAFTTGTDVAEFRQFHDGQDGVEYEAKIAEVVGRLESVRVPTIAAITGYCLGGGLVIAAACDLRIATNSARFGVPVARTLGNCLSMNSYSLLVHHFGPARTLDLLLTARLLDVSEAATTGFVAETCSDDAIEPTLERMVCRVLEHAPMSMWAAKEAARRLRRANVPPGDDIVAAVFGSEDFQRGIAAFLEKEKAVWLGR